MMKPPSNGRAQASGTWAGPGTRFDRLGKPLLYGLVITLCLFAASEVVERLWLTDVEMSNLHLLHLLRGIVGSLFVAGFVGWMIVRRSPGFLPATPADEIWTQPVQPTETERTRTYARWFIAMRWVAALLAAILVYISVQLVGWLP
ncbi:MAG: hypothetical protein Q7R41_05645, partial [Phycisphaerales bacterium]|nr:hypothetical protein [Phycisphaerales bacterium]